MIRSGNIHFQCNMIDELEMLPSRLRMLHAVAPSTMLPSLLLSALLLGLLLHVDVINGVDCSHQQCKACECKGECIKLVVVVYCLGATGDFSYLRSLPLYSCSRDIIRVPENLSLTDFLIFVAKSSSHLITSNVYACVCDLVHV